MSTSKPKPVSMPMSRPDAPAVQRLPAELLYADELAQLAAHDKAPRPPGWNLSMPAVRDFRRLRYPVGMDSHTDCSVHQAG